MSKISIDFKNDILPHLIAIVVFLIIVIGYFSPIFFKNQAINQYDILQWQGGAKELIDYREQTGEEGLWTNSMFSGMPGYLIDIDWSDEIMVFLHRLYTLGLPHPVRMIFAALLSFYILGLSFRIRPYISMVGAIVFGLSSFMIIGIAAGHNARIGAIAYMPLVIAGIHLTFTGKRWLGAGLTTAALALHLRVNHLQITYYLLLTVLIYGIIVLISAYRNGKLNEFLINISLLAAGAVVAVASFFGEFWSTYEYSKYSIRGKSELTITNDDAAQDGLDKSYAFQYSNSIFEPLTLFVPNILGGSTSNFLVSDPESNTFRALQRSGDQQTANQLARFSRSYWGKQTATAPYYAGAFMLFLLVLGILLAERRYKIWLLAVLTIGIVLSWGSNFSSFNYFMFDYFPMYNKFRSVTFTIVLALFGLSLLGCLGLETLVRQGFNIDTRKKLLTSIGISGGIYLLLILIPAFIDLSGPFDADLPVWFTSAMEKDRASILRADALRSMIFLLLGFGIVWFSIQKKLNAVLGAVFLVVLTTVDLWTIDIRYLNSENFERSPSRAFFAETEADQFIKEDQSLSYRVYNLAAPFNDARTSYHHKSIGGYHGAKLRRYQELYDSVLTRQTQQLINTVRSGSDDLSELGAINMLNARYFLAGNTRNAVLTNNYAYGNAWFVDNIHLVNSPDEELASLDDHDLRKTAVVDQSGFQVTAQSLDSTSSIVLTSYTPGALTYESTSAADQLAVFSEIYYPLGWRAFIDGDPVPIIRANYVLRALEVPAGNHRIEFRFEPRSYVVGDKVTLAGNIFALLILVATIGLEFRKSTQVTEQVEGE